MKGLVLVLEKNIIATVNIVSKRLVVTFRNGSMMVQRYYIRELKIQIDRILKAN